jgi:hypothetical protein
MLSPAEKQAVYADLSACLIRWKVRDLTGKDRQRVARELLQKHSAEIQPLIQEALTRRANGSRK